MVDTIVVAVLVAGAFGLFVRAHRWGRRRADLSMMLQGASLASEISLQHELTFRAWELTEHELTALEVRLENSRLARLLGLAPFLALDLELSFPEPQRRPGTGSARR